VEFSVFIFVLVAAVIHATWNSWLKQSHNRLLSMALMGLGWVVFSLPWIFILPPPGRASWPYLFFSTIAHVIYALFLIAAYRKVNLSVAYPLFRGSAPLMIALGSWVILGESLSFNEVIAIMLITVGILVISYHRDILMGIMLVFGVLGGALIATYTLLDGQGARLSTSALSYASWLFMFSGTPLFLLGIARSGGAMKALPMRDIFISITSGILSCTAFCIIIWALTKSPMGLVSALRETSVLMVAFISAYHLKEKVSWPGIFLMVSGLIWMRL
jgi:multidrug transporter EmrE-like cation transporter